MASTSRSRTLKIVAALGSLSAGVWASTYATFTDSATATSTFTAGTVDLTVGGEVDDDYAFTTLGLSNMKPGDSDYAALTVANVGTLGLTYSMASSATGTTLRTKLVAGIVTNHSSCDAAGYAAAVSGGGANIVMADSTFAALAIASRSLGAGGSETLCFKVAFPSDSDDTYQGQTSTSTMTFSATQS